MNEPIALPTREIVQGILDNGTFNTAGVIYGSQDFGPEICYGNASHEGRVLCIVIARYIPTDHWKSFGVVLGWRWA